MGSPRKSPTKKARRVATPRAHPTSSVMVQAAIAALKERRGSSLAAIKKYIAANYRCDMNRMNAHIRSAIRAGVAKGSLVQVKGQGASGSFRLGARRVDPAKKAAAAQRRAAAVARRRAKRAAVKARRAAAKAKRAAAAKAKRAAAKAKRAARKNKAKPRKRTATKKKSAKPKKKAAPKRKRAAPKKAKKTAAKPKRRSPKKAAKKAPKRK